jgi:hypothetical protein
MYKPLTVGMLAGTLLSSAYIAKYNPYAPRAPKQHTELVHLNGDMIMDKVVYDGVHEPKGYICSKKRCVEFNDRYRSQKVHEIVQGALRRDRDITARTMHEVSLLQKHHSNIEFKIKSYSLRANRK